MLRKKGVKKEKHLFNMLMTVEEYKEFREFCEDNDLYMGDLIRHLLFNYIREQKNQESTLS